MTVENMHGTIVNVIIYRWYKQFWLWEVKKVRYEQVRGEYANGSGHEGVIDGQIQG